MKTLEKKMHVKCPAGVRNVLFVEGNSDGTVGGSYFLMLDLIRGLDRSKFKAIAVFRFENFVADLLRESCIEVLIIPPYQPFVFSRRWMNAIFAPIKKMINLVVGFIMPSLAYVGLLRRRQIDLINLNNSITRNHPWMIAALLTSTPCITHEMGINSTYSLLSRFLGRRLDAIIALSHAIHDAMKTRGADLPNVSVIHCGIDRRRYQIKMTPGQLRTMYCIPDGVPIIGVVGNIREWKGQETIVRAVGILSDHFPTLRCVLVGAATEGDLPYVDRLKSIASSYGIGERLVFAGFQKNSVDYMQLMDVVVHTSIQPEPFGIVTLEAMMLGKPLVSTTIGGPAEVVVDGETGLLVEPGKPDMLASAIASLLNDPERAMVLGRNGRERLDAEFSLDKNLALTMEIYDRVLGGG